MIDNTNNENSRYCYKKFHCLAHHGDIFKTIVSATEDVKPICEEGTI